MTTTTTDNMYLSEFENFYMDDSSDDVHVRVADCDSRNEMKHYMHHRLTPVEFDIACRRECHRLMIFPSMTFVRQIYKMLSTKIIRLDRYVNSYKYTSFQDAISLTEEKNDLKGDRWFKSVDQSEWHHMYAMAGYTVPPRTYDLVHTLDVKVDEKVDLEKLIDENSKVLKSLREDEPEMKFILNFVDEAIGFSYESIEGNYHVMVDRSASSLVKVFAFMNVHSRASHELACQVILAIEDESDDFTSLSAGEIQYIDATFVKYFAYTGEITERILNEIRSYFGELHNRLHPEKAAGIVNPRTGLRMVHPGDPREYTYLPLRRFNYHPCGQGLPKTRSLRNYCTPNYMAFLNNLSKEEGVIRVALGKREVEILTDEEMKEEKHEYGHDCGPTSDRSVIYAQRLVRFAKTDFDLPSDIWGMYEMLDEVNEEREEAKIEAVIAGGKALAMYTGNDHSDIDIFVQSDERELDAAPYLIFKYFIERGYEVADLSNRLVDSKLKKPRTGMLEVSYANGMCVTLIKGGISIDIVVTKLPPINHVLDSFDLDICQFLFDGKALYGSHAAELAVQTRRFHVCLKHQQGYTNTYRRIRKYESRGYVFERNEHFYSMIRSVVPMRGGDDAQAFLELTADIHDYWELPFIRRLIKNREHIEKRATEAEPTQWIKLREEFDRLDMRVWRDYVKAMTGVVRATFASKPQYALATSLTLKYKTAMTEIPLTELVVIATKMLELFSQLADQPGDHGYYLAHKLPINTLQASADPKHKELAQELNALRRRLIGR